MELSGRALAGTVLSVVEHEGTRKPAYILGIDFGQAGTKRSSAQLTHLYSAEELTGRQVVALVDGPPKRIAGFTSECLVLGVQTDAGVVILQPERAVDNGSEVF